MIKTVPCGTHTNPFVGNLIHDFRIGLPFQRENEIFAASIAAGLDEQFGQPPAARDDA
jgi:hypothetical protein